MRRRSSSLLVRNPISINTEGTSGDLSTAKPAKRCPLCAVGIPLNSSINSAARTADWFIDSRWNMPSRAEVTTGSVAPRSGPPIRSALFSCCAISAASLSEARSESVKIETPLALRLGAASACNEMKTSAFDMRARSMRLRNRWKRSSSRDSRALIRPVALSWRANSRAALRLMSFSLVPETPMAPGSLPPCPGSMKTIHFRPATAPGGGSGLGRGSSSPEAPLAAPERTGLGSGIKMANSPAASPGSATSSGNRPP